LLELEHGRAYHEIDNALLLAGKTDDEIAETFGVSVATVKNYRKRLGYKPARCLVPAS
jgi:transposase